MPAPLLPGTLLIASLHLDGDEYFDRAVVLLLDYNETEDSIGLVINRPLGDRLPLYQSDVLLELAAGFPMDGFPGKIFFEGGPCKPGHLFFLHRIPERGNKRTHIADDIYACGDLEEVRQTASSAQAPTDLMRYYLGYSKWSPGQLQEEIDRGYWILGPSMPDLIFASPTEAIWQKALYALGGKYRPISFIPVDLSVH